MRLNMRDELSGDLFALKSELYTLESEFRSGVKGDEAGREVCYGAALLSIVEMIRMLADASLELQRLRSHTCDFSDKGICWTCYRQKDSTIT